MSESIAELRERLDAEPSNVQTFEALERALVQKQDIQELYRLYEDAENALSDQISHYWMRLLRHVDQAVSRAEDDEQRGRLYLRIGQIYEDKLGRPDQANASYQQAYRVCPRLSEALDRARAIYSAAGNWDLVLRLWEMQARNDRTAHAQAEIYTAMGRVCLDNIGDGARATDHARRALTQVPEHEGAQKILDDYADLTRDWQGEISVEISDARELEDPNAVVERMQEILHFVIDRVPLDKVDATPIIEELTRLDEQNVRSWVLARTWYDRAGDQESAEEAHRPLTRLLEGNARVEALREAAERAHAIARYDEEIAARRALLYAVPEDVENLQTLEELTADDDAATIRLEIYQEAIDAGVGEPAVQIRKAAHLARELERYDQAETLFTQLRDHEASAQDALEFLYARAAERNDARSKYALLLDWAPLLPNAEQAERWAEAAMLADQDLQQPHDAIEAWKQRRALLPDDLDARRALSDLYTRTQAWEPLAEHLEQERVAPDPIDDPDAITDALIALYTTRVDNLPRALEHLHTRVQSAPEDHAIGEQLRAVARRANVLEDVRADLLMRIENASPEARFPWVDEVARLELELDRKAAARPWLDELVQSEEVGLDLLRVRRDIAKEEGDHAQIIALQRRIAKRLSDTQHASEESLHLAEFAEEAEDHSVALEAYKDVLAREGNGHTNARQGAMRALEALQQWNALADLLNIELEHEPTAQTHARLATIAEQHLEDLTRAVQHRNQAIALDPQDHASARMLIHHYAQHHAWDALERVAMDTALPEEGWDAGFAAWTRAASDLEGGSYADSPLPQVHQQLKTWAERDLNASRKRYDVSVAHAQHQDDVDSWLAAANAAKDHHLAQEEYGAIVHAAQRANTPEHAATYWTRAANLAEHQDAIASDGWQERHDAWRAIPNDTTLRDPFTKSSIATGRIDAYAKALDAQLDHVEDASRTRILRDLGVLYAGPLQDPEKSRYYWERLRTEQPDDREALEALYELYDRAEHPEERLDVIQGLLRQDTLEQREALERERAMLFDDALQQPNEAIEAWKVVQNQGGEHAQHAIKRIETLLRETERYADLQDFFSEQLGHAATPEDAAKALVLRGVLRVDLLDSLEEGTQDLMNVITGFSDTEAATHADAALRAHVVGENDAVVDTLVTWHDAHDRLAVADDLLEIRVQAHGEHDAARWRTLVQRLRARADQPLRLIEHWVDYQLAHSDTREEASEMMLWSRENNRSSDLVAAWGKRLLEISAPPQWWSDYLTLAVETGADTDNVLAVLRRLRTLDETQTEAIDDAIEELLASVGRFQEQIEVIDARAKTSSADRAAARYVAAGQIAEFGLEDASQAADFYLKALGETPSREDLVESLIRNLFAAERWAEATNQLRTAYNAFPNSADQAQWQAQLARAASRAGESDETVYNALKTASEQMPSAPAVAEGLADLAFREDADPDIARKAATLHLALGVADSDVRRQLHERLVTLNDEPERRLKALVALGDLIRHEESHYRRAWEVHAEALALDPASATIANRLEKLAGELQEWRATSELFAELGTAQNEETGSALLERAVRIEVEERNDLERAVNYQEALLTKSGDTDERLAKLESWYNALHMPDKCVETLDRRAKVAEISQDISTLRDVRMRAVKFTSEQLELHEDTVRRWQEIAEAHPDVRAYALEELSRAHRAQSEWSALDAVLSQRVELNEEQEERHALLREQAAVREEALNNLEGAIESFARIGQEDLENIDALNELDRLYLTIGDQAARYRCIQERFGRSGHIDDRLHLARAGLELEDERENALQSLCNLVVQNSEVQKEALETLAELAETHPEYLNLERWMLLAQALQDADDLAAAARANLHVANALQDADRAIERRWLAVEQRLTALDALEDAADMAVTLWRESGCDPERQELVQAVVRQAQREQLYADAVEARLERRPNAQDLREDLVRWYMEDLPNEARRRAHLQVLFEANPNDDTIYADLLSITPESERVSVLRVRMNATAQEDERQRLRATLGLSLAASHDAEEKLEAQRLLEAFRMTQSTNEEVNQTLRALLADGGHWSQLASLIEEELWLTDDRQERVRLLVERARCREREDALPSMLVEGWFDVLAEDASQPDAIIVLTEIAGQLDDPFLVARVQDRLELAYEKSQRWEDLYELLRKRSEQLDGIERTETLQRAAQLANHKLHDQERVFDIYLLLIEHDPAVEGVLDDAVQAANSLEQKEQLREAIDHGLQRAQIDPELRTRLRRLAALLKAAVPGEEAHAIEALSVIFDARKPWQIVEDVRNLYNDQPDAYIAWLHARADAVDDLEVRIRLLREASDVLISMPGHEEQAGAILESIFLLSPSLQGAEEIDALYRRVEHHKLRATFWAARLQDAQTIAPIIELHHRLHQCFVADQALWAEQIKHLGTWWDAIDDAAHTENPPPSIEKSRAIWRDALKDTIARWSKTTDRAEREGDMLDALMKRVGIPDTDDQLFQARIEVASSEERADVLWEERIRNHAENISLQKAWKTAATALQSAPERDARGATIERLANELKNYEEAAALLRHVSQGHIDTRFGLALRAARIDLEELDLQRRATRTLQSVLEVKPDYMPARTMMRSILDQNPRDDLRQRILSVLINTAPEPAEKSSLSMIGARAADQRHDIYEAKKYVRNALAFDPGNTDARSFLIERRNDTGWHDVLAEDFLPVLRNENALEELKQVIEALAAQERNAEKKAAYAAEVANLLAQSDEGSDGALNAWLQALRAHPHSPSYLENAVNAVSGNADAIVLIDTLESIAEDAQGDEIKASLYAAAGHAQIERLGDTENGVANLLRAIQVNPRNERALDGLETYYLETADYNGLATLLEARLNATEEPEAKRTLADRVVTLLRGELGRPNDAAKVLEESLELTGPDEHLLEELRASYHEAGNTKGEVTTLERLATCATDVDERIDLRTEALQRASEHPALADRALQLADALLLDDQQHPLALSARAKILRLGDDLIATLNAQLAVVDLHADDEAASTALQYAFTTEVTPQKNVILLITRLVVTAMERGLLTEIPAHRLAAWLTHLPVAEQRRVIQAIVEEETLENRRQLLVASLRALRASTDELLGNKVSDIIEQNNPREEEENEALATWFETTNQYDRAANALRNIVDSTDDPQKKGETLLKIAKMEEERENFGVLMGLYEEALAVGLRSPALYNGLGRGYEREQNWDALIQVLSEQLKDAADTERARLLRRIANVYRNSLHNDEVARDFLLEALKINADVPTQLDLMEAHVALSEQAQAKRIIHDLASEHLQRAMRHRVDLARGRIALQNNDWQTAKNALIKAHEHVASHAGTLLSLAQAHIALQEWSDAQEALQAALVNQDQLTSIEKSTTFVLLARVQAQEGYVERARELVTRALRLEPNLEDALALEAELNAVP